MSSNGFSSSTCAAYCHRRRKHMYQSTPCIATKIATRCRCRPAFTAAAFLVSTLIGNTHCLSTSSTNGRPTPTSSLPNNFQSNAVKVERPRIPVLQYENDWVCVNKPAGLTVHRAKGTSPRKFVLSTLLKRQLSRKVFPVHRLDHRTSGAILFAFDSETAGRLHGSLRSDDAQKHYVALLRGDLDVKVGQTVTIDKALKVDGVEKEARTDFTLLASMAGSDNQRGDIEAREDFVPACSLVLCEPKTGRTHQIRRHAYSLGHPVLGDTEHGDSRVNRWWRNNRGLNRLCLHCLSLDLPSIKNGNDDDEANQRQNNEVKCLAPIPPDFLEVLKSQALQEIWEAALQREPRLASEFVDLRGGSFGRNYKKDKKIQ